MSIRSNGVHFERLAIAGARASQERRRDALSLRESAHDRRIAARIQGAELRHRQALASAASASTSAIVGCLTAGAGIVLSALTFGAGALATAAPALSTSAITGAELEIIGQLGHAGSGLAGAVSGISGAAGAVTAANLSARAAAHEIRAEEQNRAVEDAASIANEERDRIRSRFEAALRALERRTERP